jgi:hypothetical protein
MKYDFAIMSLPRSGSHMLMSALHSHPDVTMTGEIGMVDKFPMMTSTGGVNGIIIPSYRLVDVIDISFNFDIPFMFITRPIGEIVYSLFTDSEHGQGYRQSLVPSINESHQQFPATEGRINRLQTEYELMNNFMDSRSEGRDVMVTYDELCGGVDTREIKCGDEICDWLGIDRHPLVPVTHKL